MRTLFWKIFGWFFLSNALIVALIVAVFAAMRASDESERPRRENWERRVFAPSLGVVAEAAALSYQNGGAPASARLLRETEREMRGRLYLFNGRGQFLASSSGANADGAPALTPELLSALKERPVGGTSNESERLVTRRVVLNAGRDYVLVLRLPARVARGNSSRANSPRGNSSRPDASRDSAVRDLRRWDGLIWFLLQPNQLPLRMGIFLLGAGLVCYGLAQYLTSPVRKLRLATQRLSAGDLSARVGPELGARRDELADLGRDFDAMAGRIETLLGSQQRLLGDISHELRSPLARMQVALDLADGDANAEVRPHLERIQRESGRLNALIGQLLALTRLESGETGLAREKVDLRALVEDVAGDAAFEAEQKKRRVEARLEAREICGDAALLRSAIENVVRNAVRYTRENTSVEIELRGEGEQTQLCVRDHGPGVPETALADLFRPFYRVEGARDRSSGGEGLGLAIAERAVRAHGGQIRARNHPEGGLEVEIRLPTREAQ